MNKIQKRFIKDAQDAPEKLTDWEYDFIESIALFKDTQELSERQNKVLNRISQKLQE